MSEEKGLKNVSTFATKQAEQTRFSSFFFCDLCVCIIYIVQSVIAGMSLEKQIMDEFEKKSSMPPPPHPPLPPSPGYGSRKIDGDRITNKQIKKFWRQKQIIEEDEDYKRFEESLEMEDPETEVHQRIKDWWTKSKYAYLNQPAL